MTKTLLLLFLPFLWGQKQNLVQCFTDSVSFQVESQYTLSGRHTPIYLNANKFGLSSVKGNNGYLRAGIFGEKQLDNSRKWFLSYGADLAVARNFTSPFVVQQLYADVCYKWLTLSVGSKEHSANLKNHWLSTGSQTLGVNARPIPQLRIEVPDYQRIDRKNWFALRGHLSYGTMTDGSWQHHYAGSKGFTYTDKALFHSKSGFIRLGNEQKFPLVLEAGLEMATIFGADSHNFSNEFPHIQMKRNAKAFLQAFFMSGSDVTDAGYDNAAGNTLGSWLLSISYKGKGWQARAYADHFFDDHSQLFFEYWWKDALLGIEIQLPDNKVIGSLVYEHIRTKDQTGPIYHDHTESVPDQISGRDSYYNHLQLQGGWQHWGQAIGNPLFKSFLYDEVGRLYFKNNRFVANHFAISGSPAKGVDYRILYTYSRNWGTYDEPYSMVLPGHSFLAEVKLSSNKWKGWSASAAFALDRGQHTGRQTGLQLTLRKAGCLHRK